MAMSTGDIVGTTVGATLGAYVLTVLLLYRFPCLLHRKNTRRFDGFLIAHRGGAGERLENTLGAFRHAVRDTKADVLELDVHLTKDKQVVVCHDSNMKRATGVDVVLEEVDYADLPTYLQHLDVTFSPGQRCEPECEDTKVPLFEDLLRELPDTVLNIDLKQGNQELVEITGELLKRYNRTQSVVWGSSTNHVLEMCYKYDPSIPIYFSVARVFKFLALYWTGLAAFLPIREYALELPYVSGSLKESARSRLPAVMRFGLTVSQALLVNRFIIGYLKRRGVETWIFVLNDEESWREMYEIGVAGVHTDYPTQLRQFLDENPQYTCSENSEPGERDGLVAGQRSEL